MADPAIECNDAGDRIGIVDHDALARSRRMEEFREQNAAGRQARLRSPLDGAKRLAQEQRAGNDRIARKVPAGGGEIRGKNMLGEGQSYPAFRAGPPMSSLSASRGSLPVMFRGSASTNCNGRGKKAASMR
ncbi:hypothetical protein D3C83_03710 [compost metagenome]